MPCVCMRRGWEGDVCCLGPVLADIYYSNKQTLSLIALLPVNSKILNRGYDPV